MTRRRLTVLLLATFVVVSAFAPASVSAQTAEEPSGLTIDVAQDPETGNATVTVTNGTDALSGEQVNVSSADPYAGNGTYVTDENGTAELPNPDETVEVDVEVTYEGTTLVESVTLVPRADSLDVAITQSQTDGSVTVDVAQYGTPVEDATVNVSSDAPYAENGTYETDANGTVTLAEPEETLNVTANVTSGDLEASATAEVTDIDTGYAVSVEQNSDGSAVVTVTNDSDPVENATVNVTSDVAYEGNGTYNTSESGTVDLPAPDENVTIDVVASVNGSEKANTTAELTVVENGGYANFGHWVTAYIDQLRTEGYFGKEFGQAVSSFATQNNPGADKKPDHAGPKDDDEDESASAADASDDDKRGPPEHAKNKKADEDAEANEDEQGPPEHAKNKQDDEEADDDDAQTSEDKEDCSVDASDDDCDDDHEDEDESSHEEDDSPGKSGSRGNGGNGHGK